jgi:DNA-binding response OmpR family regulator
MKILIVDDEVRLVEGLRKYFEQAGFQVLAAYDGPGGLSKAINETPDLVLLDLMLPGMDGLDVCREIRRRSNVPIIMLTARVEETDKLIGLELGADDYITKPFSPREVVARARTVLRRVQPQPALDGLTPAQIFRYKDFTLDTGTHQITLGERVEALTPTEFDLLLVLVTHKRQVLTRSQLLDAARLGAYEGVEKTIDVHMHNLRRKLEPHPTHPRYLRNVFCVGYRFNDEGA